MAYIIDRRKNGKNKSSENRRKFLHRQRKAIADAVRDAISGRNISDVGKKGTDVNIKRRNLNEPTFQHDYNTGVRKGVNPGNKKFQKGDVIQRPDEDQGQGSGAGNGGDGEQDDFVFHISREEFLQYFFDDLELPDMVKKDLAQSEEFKWKRAGVTSSGIPTNLDLIRSMRQSLGRRLALRGPHSREITRLQLELDDLLNVRERDRTDEQKALIIELTEALSLSQRRHDSVPYLDKIDLRYRVHQKERVPVTAAVMFCVMDVSGSMGSHEKDLAKRFYTLLYLFLERNYDKVDIRFIRHHHEAKEVNEQDFFYSRETGGTVVSDAMVLVKEIIDKDYTGGGWNVYVAQASDGDNWDEGDRLSKIMQQQILPSVQYFAYIEVGQEGSHRSKHDTAVWRTYAPIREQNSKLAMTKVYKPSEIYPVFRELFKKG